MDGVQRNAANLEKLRNRLIDEVKNVLEKLEKKYRWDEAYIFGSLIQKNKFQSHSDVDIALLGLNKFDHYAFVGDISEMLNREVDVIRLEECQFSESIIHKGIRCRPNNRS